mmetsp:Transcript_13027/g.29124  ORF Transcript_13027/g.29124 Transcript_13027/m.29124 type:complete len:231 (+) Transcript_13027:890-1582(+)
MAGKSSSPFSAMEYSLCTPVVVSSDTPTMRVAHCCHLVGFLGSSRRIRPRMSLNSALVVDSGSGRVLSIAYNFSAFTPSWMSRVMSPPSSTIMSQPSPLASTGQVMALRVHSQYSSRVSPFQANTAAEPSRAMAAAAWSWVEKMLHEHHLTSAPRALRVSMSTAVWMVMCREPEIRAPLKQSVPYSFLQAMRPGISYSASSISLRPKSASEISATLKSPVDILEVGVWKK